MAGEGDTFLADSYAFYIDFKQATIPSKGVANILSHKDSWKLAYYGNEDTLYLSNDCGVTWLYSIAFPGECDNIRMAYVFSNGNILIGTLDNKLYHSFDLLSTITEFYCSDAVNGGNLAFHSPVNPLYPGAYFATVYTESFIQGDKEILIFGNYPHWNNYGATPIKIYATTDRGITLKCVYHFGQCNNGDPTMLDDGTADGGAGGSLLGDATNPIIVKHYHATGYDSVRNEFWLMFGDDNDTSRWFKAVYTEGTDSFAFTNYSMGLLSAYFRSVGMRFNTVGDYVFWASDGNGNIYKVPQAHMTHNLPDHELKYDNANNLLGLTKYGEKMATIGHATVINLMVSIDYGENWVSVPYNYRQSLGQAVNYALFRVYNADDDGFMMVHRTQQIIPLNCKSTWLFKIKDKPVH
jgi:hypothetical protein